MSDHKHIHRALARGGQYTTPTIGKTEREFLKQNPEYTKVRVPGEVLRGQPIKGPFGRLQGWGGTTVTPDSWKIIPKAVGKLTNEEVITEAPYYSLEASKARMAKEKARAAAKEAVAAAKKNASEARKNAKAAQSYTIARHIEAEVGNHYPDSDGYDAIASKLHKMGIGHHDAITHMDKAARKHLGAKSFSHYVDNFHKDYGS